MGSLKMPGPEGRARRRTSLSRKPGAGKGSQPKEVSHVSTVGLVGVVQQEEVTITLPKRSVLDLIKTYDGKIQFLNRHNIKDVDHYNRLVAEEAAREQGQEVAVH